MTNALPPYSAARAVPRPPGPPRPGTAARGRRSDAAVALLFVAGTLTFAAGDALRVPEPAAAAALQVATGLAVLGTGLLLRPALRRGTPGRARAYLLLRALECAALVALAAWMLAVGAALPSYELPVYALSAAAGLVLCSALLTSRLVPRWLAAIGLTGYAALLVGTALDVAGVMDLTTGAGPVFLAPGAVFEVAFPVLLLLRGLSR